MFLSPSGNFSIIYGADVTLTSANPIWGVINMTKIVNVTNGGELYSNVSNLRIMSGFSGRMYVFGGFFLSDTQYVVQLSSGGVDPY